MEVPKLRPALMHSSFMLRFVLTHDENKNIARQYRYSCQSQGRQEQNCTTILDCRFGFLVWYTTGIDSFGRMLDVAVDLNILSNDEEVGMPWMDSIWPKDDKM
jgi:hypothetical protein